MPCLNRSRVTMSLLPRGLADRGQIHGKPRHLAAVRIAHYQYHPTLRVQGRRREAVHAVRQVPPVLLTPRAALVLDEGGAELAAGARDQPGRVEAGEVAARPPEGHPE